MVTKYIEGFKSCSGMIRNLIPMTNRYKVPILITNTPLLTLNIIEFRQKI